MANHDDVTRHYIAALRGAGWENAYHSLMEVGGNASALLAEAFRSEREPGLRQLLLRLLWQTRSHDALPCLMQALEDDAQCVWKEALDGLVALGEPRAIEGLRAARAATDLEKAEWIDEAIAQILDPTLSLRERG
jgi:hypothetical protein